MRRVQGLGFGVQDRGIVEMNDSRHNEKENGENYHDTQMMQAYMRRHTCNIHATPIMIYDVYDNDWRRMYINATPIMIILIVCICIINICRSIMIVLMLMLIIYICIIYRAFSIYIYYIQIILSLLYIDHSHAHRNKHDENNTATIKQKTTMIHNSLQ